MERWSPAEYCGVCWASLLTASERSRLPRRPQHLASLHFRTCLRVSLSLDFLNRNLMPCRRPKTSFWFWLRPTNALRTSMNIQITASQPKFSTGKVCFIGQFVSPLSLREHGIRCTETAIVRFARCGCLALGALHLRSDCRSRPSLRLADPVAPTGNLANHRHIARCRQRNSGHLGRSDHGARRNQRAS